MKKTLSIAIALIATNSAFANTIGPAQASEILAQQAEQLNNGVNAQTINQLLQTANQAQQQLSQNPI
ncbi:hypothetical protein, partial [Acinetobacter lwoffii]